MNLFSHKEIIEKLVCTGDEQRELFLAAQEARAQVFGKLVEVRSVVESSNICVQGCLYCGMSCDSLIERYTMSDSQIERILNGLATLGRKVIMIQSGENGSAEYTRSLLNTVEKISRDYCDISFIFSLGMLTDDEYRQIAKIPGSRYLLKFETSDADLYQRIKPGQRLADRLQHIEKIAALNIPVSSGNITQLPGSSLEVMANDLLLLKRLPIAMGSTSPFISHSSSHLKGHPNADVNLTLNSMAILRILRPDLLIPTVSSLEKIQIGGQRRGLLAGANTVTLHDGTPKELENLFSIYDSKRPIPRNELLAVVEELGLTPASSSLLGFKNESL